MSITFLAWEMNERLPYSPCLIFDLTVASFSSQRVSAPLGLDPLSNLLFASWPVPSTLAPLPFCSFCSLEHHPVSPACALFAVDTPPGIQGLLLKGPYLWLVPHSINLKQTLFFLPSVTFAAPPLFLCLHLPWGIPPPFDFI